MIMGLRSCWLSVEFLVIFMATGFWALLMTQISYADTLEGLRRNLPKQINAWTAEAQDRIYDPQTIFTYIDGGAEVYRAYNLQQCLSRRYTVPSGPAIIVDIFDMGSSQDAFGVFTHDSEGETIELGQDGRLRPGWLRFWKDRFFVSIYVEEETAAAEKAIRKLAQQIASLIETRGDKPQILLNLPQHGLKSESIRYLHHPIILNYHFYLADENILNLSARTDAVLAEYERDQGRALLLLVSYPDPAAASQSLASFFRFYLPDADQTGLAVLENGKWSAAALKDRLLAIVLEADSRQLANDLIETIHHDPD
jgi:hypothetical protein